MNWLLRWWRKKRCSFCGLRSSDAKPVTQQGVPFGHICFDCFFARIKQETL